MEKRQSSPSRSVGSSSSEENIPGESANDSSDLERADRSLATQQVQQMRQIFPALPAPVTPIEESNTQQRAPVPIGRVSPSRQRTPQSSPTTGRLSRSPILEDMLTSKALKTFDLPDDLFSSSDMPFTLQSATEGSSRQFDTMSSSSLSPTERFRETAPSYKSTSKVSTSIEHSLLSPTEHPSSQFPSKDSTFEEPTSLSPPKDSISPSPSTSSTFAVPYPPSPTKRPSFLSPPQRQSLSSPTKRTPTKRAGSQSPMRGSGKSASGSPTPVKQLKLYDQGSDKSEYNMVRSLKQLFKCMERIHFHPIHEFCTCPYITGEILYFPESAKVTKTISKKDIEIRVDVRFYEIKNIFVRVKEDAVSVEATLKTEGTSYEYHHIHQVFSLPSRLKNEKLCATIKNSELIIKKCSPPEPSSKEKNNTAGIVKQKKDPALPPSEQVTRVASRQDGEQGHQPRPVEFTTFASSSAFQLQLNVGLFNVKDITVNLIEDKILIEAKREDKILFEAEREAHDEYEFHYLDRAVPMPRGLQESSLSAKIRNGVLLVEGIVKPVVAEPRKIPWLSCRAKPVFSKNFVYVPVVGHEGPYRPEPVEYAGIIGDSQFTVKLNVQLFEKDDIYVWSEGKKILILAERRDSSPFEYHYVYKYCTLPIIVDNFDLKSWIVDKHLVVEGSVKQK